MKTVIFFDGRTEVERTQNGRNQMKLRNQWFAFSYNLEFEGGKPARSAQERVCVGETEGLLRNAIEREEALGVREVALHLQVGHLPPFF